MPGYRTFRFFVCTAVITFLILSVLHGAVPYDSTRSGTGWESPGSLTDGREAAGPDSSRRLPPDSLRVTIGPDSLRMSYADPVHSTDPWEKWAFEPGVGLLRISGFGQGAFMQQDGAWVRADRLLTDGMPWTGGGTYACDLEQVPVYPAAVITVPGPWGEMRLDGPRHHRVYPYTQIDFQQNSFLPFLAIPETWRSGGVRFFTGKGPFDFHLAYRTTENVIRDYDYITADVAGFTRKTAAVTYTWRDRVRFRLYAGEHAVSHATDTLAAPGFTETEPTGRGFAGLDVQDDSTGLVMQGRITGEKIPRYPTYLYLADTASGYRADIRLGRRWRYGPLDQEMEGSFRYRYEQGDYGGEQTGQSVPELDIRHTVRPLPELTVRSRLDVQLCSFASTVISPGVQTVWQPSEVWRFDLKVWRQSHIPSLAERVHDDPRYYPGRTPNLELLPEKLDGIRCGIRLRPSDALSVTGHAFGRLGTDYIQTEQDGTGLVRRNIPHTLHYGAGLALGLAGRGGWETRLRYTWAVAKDRDADTDLLYHPRQDLLADIGYGRAFYQGVLRPRATLRVQGRGAGYGYDRTRDRTAEVPAYCVLDFLLETAILDATLFFNTENLLDHRYRSVPGMTMPGRLYRMGIRWFFWN